MEKGRLRRLIGIEAVLSGRAEKLVSGVGGIVAIYCVYLVSRTVLEEDAFLIVASMGAATVLLFAVPHGPLSQPWPLVGGNLVSALIGVTSAGLIADPFLAASVAVGAAVAAMHWLRCIHPPGGATALSAVAGGPAVAELGYQYVLTPVLLNVATLLAVAVMFNAPFAWRRYPAALSPAPAASPQRLSHEGIEYALRRLDTFVDVSEEDLERICELAEGFDRGRVPLHRD